MKKILTLLLFLTAIVGTANAWTGTLHGSFDSWGNGIDFQNLNDKEMILTLPGNYIHANGIEIKPYINDKGWRGPDAATALTNNDNDYKWCGGSGSANFTIAQNTNAKEIIVYIKTNDNPDWWGITAYVVEEAKESYPVSFNNDGNWSNVYAYTYLNLVPLNGAWPGTQMSGSGSGTYTTTLSTYPSATIIFNNNDNTETGHLDLVYNGVYNHPGGEKPTNCYVGVKASVTSVGYATFSSTKAVDFTGTNIKAYKASVFGGSISYDEVTSVAAGEGVLLRPADGTISAASDVIPLNANQSVSSNSGNAFVGITSRQLLAQSTESGYTNFILTKTLVSGESTLGFYKVNSNGSWCAAGTAYLKVANGNIPANANGYFPLFGEDVTAINAINQEQSLNGPVYNIAGQRVANPTRGLYIVNGKKVLVK